MLIMVMLFLVTVQGGTPYEASFTGGDAAPIKGVSLCADENSLYLAYISPDSDSTVIVKLSPELEEIGSIRMEGWSSPCIKAFGGFVYLAGIKEGSILVQVFSSELEPVKDFKMRVEEPTYVYILPYKEGILLSYVHRFLEDDLLRQDVFVRKVDFSFTQLAEVRLTSWDYWEDPSLVVYGDSIVVAYGNAPIVPILDRHVVVTRLNSNLEKTGEVRYPKEANVEDGTSRNVVQPEIVALDDGVLLLFRVTDRTFSYSKFTWKGSVTFVPGNIQGVKFTEDLTVEEEVTISHDYREHYSPAAVYAFGRIYLAHSIKEETSKKVQVIYADSVESVKVEPPPSSKGYIYGTVVAVVAAALILVVVRLKSRKKAKKSRK